ncbi:MAG: terminase family protein, partial [Gammaproteobacteria bacterium]|nr:terminase family protein [Gammaproteobacteria bacterium]
MSAKSSLGVKLPTDINTLTAKQANEMVKCLNDVEYFIRNYVYVQHPTRGAVLFDLYDYQERVVDSLVNHEKSIILQPRQSGKTITIVAYMLHRAIFFPDVVIGVAAHKGDGAKEVIGRFRYGYENLPLWMKPAVRSYNVFDIVFDNGSKIMSQTTTESTYRGKSLSILYLDEFAFVNPRIETEFWKSILPTISAKGTEFVITSTPNTSEGRFADIWFKAERGESDFNPIRVYNEEVPDRQELNENGEDFKTAMLKDMTPIEYAQEYDCAFVS